MWSEVNGAHTQAQKSPTEISSDEKKEEIKW